VFIIGVAMVQGFRPSATSHGAGATASPSAGYDFKFIGTRELPAHYAALSGDFEVRREGLADLVMRCIREARLPGSDRR